VITEHDLREAIAECEGDRKPNANTCLKLASYYTIKDHLYPAPNSPVAEPNLPTYSTAAPPEEVETTIDYYSDTEFGRLINGKKASEVWPVIDELINKVIQHISPRLYDAVLRKIDK